MNRQTSPLKAFVRATVDRPKHSVPTIPAQLDEWAADANNDAAPVELPGVKLRLHFRSAGQLNPWMGPSLRGLLAKPLKDHWCRLDAATRDREFVHCAGCQFQGDCAFAKLLEPLATDSSRCGWKTQPHRMALIPHYLVAPRLSSRVVPAPLDLRLLFIETESNVVDETIMQLTDCGQRLGLGPDRIRFDVERLAGDTPSLSIEQLDTAWDRIRRLPQSATIPSVSIRVTTPTLLKRDNKLLGQPQMFDFVAASLRLLHSLLTPDEDGQERITGVQLDRFKHLATGVSKGRSKFRTVVMRRKSNRTGDRYRNDGIIGCAEYQNVPTVLVEIIKLAGPLGIGQQRVCGSGQVSCVADETPPSQ